MENKQELETLKVKNAELETRCKTLQEAVKMQGNFADIANTVSSAVELPDLTATLLDKILSTTRIRAGAFFLRNENNLFDLIRSNGMEMSAEYLEEKLHIFSESVQTKDMAIREDAETNNVCIITQGANSVKLCPQMIASFPCNYEDNVNSLMIFADTEPISIDMLSFISALTPNIALSVNNALSYERIRKTTKALDNEKNKLNAVIKNINDGLVVTAMDNSITMVNPAVEKMLGIPANEIISADVSSVFSVIDIGELISAVITSRGEEVAQRDFKLNGRVIRAISYAIKSENELLGIITILRDITKEWEVDRMKTEFISTVSHELRTPLTSVLGFARIIKKRFEEILAPQITAEDSKTRKAVKQVGENLNIIVSEGERLTALINDVLDIAKMEAGKVDWKSDPISVSEIIDRATTATASLFGQKGLQLIKDIGDNLPEITGDRDRLIQVVINLISNAVKFTEAGSITCRAAQKNNQIVISVIDMGMGITAEDIPKVFEKFKQVGDTLTDKPTGTGLGLPICKEIVEHHGGTIWVESEPGKGSNFSFTVPVSKQKDKAKTADLDILMRHLQDNLLVAVPPIARGKKTILVVDDEKHIRELLRQVLEENGYNVLEAQDGIHAITQIKKQMPDLITLDVMMPGISGFDVAAVLKSDPVTAAIPIIILSIIEDKERGYRLGIDKYLTKPVDTEALLDHIDSILSKGPSKKKVLVIDDDISVVKALRDVLDSKGYHITEAFDGPDGLDKAQKIKPDMIIVDSVLSDAHDIVKTLRFEKGLENILFIVMADEASGEKIEKAKKILMMK